ncbi:melanoma inhibitory activity protein 2 isoform X5 [Hemicordylus capensis]|uniref:melanoma inhibitory activity protein 2 isoform X5 n=1 Tax=Hemicordylus capensis TaxID=884348 RepID=UPI00230357F5|nr:melanoma inhibitory activity protein 2 isoform X5 [Hemicordylus capensis]
MLEILDVKTLLLILSLLTNTKSTKLLSEQKKCGDPECETSMSRVQAIKDHVGPDCRYLNFTTGEEIMVYFKLSRKREDLWAGSKGQDFGYFPVDAVQIEEVFIKEEVEVEVPTKETDFVCLDGGEYIFENEDSILNHNNDENVYIPLYTDEKDSELHMTEYEAPKHIGIASPKEFKKPFPDSDEFDSKSKDLHILENTNHDDSELGCSKTEQDETIQQEDQRSKILKSDSTLSTWTVSDFTGWFSWRSKQNKEATGEIPGAMKQIPFRHRKIAITDDNDFKNLNDESEREPSGSSRFLSSLTNLLHYGSKKSGLDLLYKENEPEIHDSSTIAGNADHHASTTTPETKEEDIDSEVSKSNWYDLQLSDILMLGYSKQNKVRREKHADEETADQNEEARPLSSESIDTLIDEGLRKPTVVSIHLEEQNNERYVQEASKEAVESILHEEHKENYVIEDPDSEVKKIDSEVQVANEHTDSKDAAVTSFSTEPADKLLKCHYTEQDSVSDNQVMEHISTKAITKESERKNDQSEAKHNEESREKTQNEGEWLFQIILHLNDFCYLLTSVFSTMMTWSKKAVAVLSENMRPDPDLYGFPWELVICGAIVAMFTIFLLMCRSYQSIKSRRYIGREKQLASKVAELVEDKCKVLETLSLCKKEYEALENSLKDASLVEGLTITSNIKTAYEELNSSNCALKNEIECLEKELEEEKAKRSEQDDLMAEIQRRMESLENEAKSIQMQVAEAKTTLKVYEINRERLKTSVQNAMEENSHLHESEKQLLQEAEGWGERFSELNEQTKMFETSKADMEEALKNKDSQIKSLTECLLKMKDWSCVIGEHDAAEGNHLAETENGAHLADDQEKLTVKKLIRAAKLNACLKSLETERNQIYSKLTDENKAKEELEERIENLQREHVMLQSGNTHFESEVQKLQQKLKVMTELYQENEINLHRKLTVEEKERLQKEEKLSKVDEKISYAAEELNTYRQRAKDLEEELERTVRSYQSQIMSHEKKAHDNWLTARAAERHLNDIRKENSHNRQKLTEAEFKYDLLEKDPYALDIPVRAFGREHSPYGPSPMGRPSSETRAFLSPPTLLEGPLRLSPVLLGGGGRGSRGPGNAGMYETGNERGELNSGRLSDPHRPPSDTGSLSPPWDRDRRIIPPPAGQQYNEQSLPFRRPERYYSNPPNSGRLSGPAELRSYNVHSFDKADGQSPENSSRIDLSGNGIKDERNVLNVSDQSLAPESETFIPGVMPPPLPLLRAPLLPVDPRGPFMRRASPFPSVPPSAVYGSREYFPRDFAGLPHPPLSMRGPFPMRPFSQYPPPRAGFFPPPPSDNRNELPAELTHQSTVPSTDHQESQQET